MKLEERIVTIHALGSKSLEPHNVTMNAIVVDDTFIIHDALAGDDIYFPIVIAHLATTCKIVTCIGLHAAIHFAQELLNLGLDWSFTDPSAVKEWPAEIVGLIRGIQTAARDQSLQAEPSL